LLAAALVLGIGLAVLAAWARRRYSARVAARLRIIIALGLAALALHQITRNMASLAASGPPRPVAPFASGRLDRPGSREPPGQPGLHLAFPPRCAAGHRRDAHVDAAFLRVGRGGRGPPRICAVRLVRWRTGANAESAARLVVAHRVPPANLQAVFMRLQRMDYSAGDVVIRQGDEGDYFYVIVGGRCAVSRETPLNREGIRLAELGIGETFGEEALISGATRNATVTMLTDGVLMRLAKDDFNTLLNEPMLQWVDYDEGLQIVAKGGAWLDVRLPSEYEHWHLEPSLNVPLYFIRLKIKTLDPATRYVVVCDNGRRSSAAAYILSERGFDTYVLRGGIAATGLADKLIP